MYSLWQKSQYVSIKVGSLTYKTLAGVLQAHAFIGSLTCIRFTCTKMQKPRTRAEGQLKQTVVNFMLNRKPSPDRSEWFVT